MGTDFGIKIAIDPGNSKQGIDGLNTALSQLEATGAKVNERLRDQSGRFSTTGAAAKTAAEGVRVLTEEEQEFERMVLLGNAAIAAEEAQLKKLMAPMQQLQREIELINTLHEKGAIDTNTFTDAITKRNQALARMQPRSGLTADALPSYGPVFDPSKAGAGGGGGDSGSGLGGAAATLGIGLGIGAAVSGLKELSSAVIDSNDRWIDMTNSVRKFTDANHSVDDVIRQQREIALEIRASTTESIALYDRVHNATASLYLSTGTVVDITKSLGLVAKENNIPLEAVEGTLKRLAFAADTGAISTRELKSMFATMPELSRVLADSFHVSQKQFDDLATSGKISARDIYLAIASYLPQAADKIKDFNKTSKDEVQEWYLETYQGIGGVKTEYEKWIETQKKNADAAEQEKLNIKNVDDALATLTTTMAKLVSLSDSLFSDSVNARIEKFNAAITSANIKAVGAGAQSNALAALGAFGAAPNGLVVQAQRDATKAMDEAKFSGEGWGKTILDLVDKSDNLHNTIDNLRASMASGKLTTDQYNLAAKELASALKSAGAGVSEFDRIYRSLYEGLRKGQLEYAIGEKAAAAIFVNGLSTMQQYADMLDKIRKAREAAEVVRPLDGGVGADTLAYDLARGRQADKVGGSTAYSTALGSGPAGGIDIGNGLDGQDKIQAATAAHRVLEDALAQSRNATARYDEEVQKLNHSLIGLTPDAGEYSKALESIRDRYNDAKDPQEVFAKGVKDAQEKLDAGIYSLDGYAKKLHELREAAGTGTLGDGFKDFTESLKKQSEDSKTSLDLLNTGLSDVHKGLVDLLQSKGSLSGFFGSFADDISSILLKLAEMKLAMALIGLAGPQSIETSLASTIFGAGLPGHASGAYYPPGGGGGTDSQIVAFRKSPSEDVLVRTPEQQRAMQQGGSHPAPIINVITGNRDRRDLSPPMTRNEITVHVRDEVARALRRR